ncbi:hypothetical protein BD779DRAFT_322285 [Infundibulicybe gibba]|nr:hypothetical protein BD779DRAFT_322285 [Infundibulicybe gibba]
MYPFFAPRPSPTALHRLPLCFLSFFWVSGWSEMGTLLWNASIYNYHPTMTPLADSSWYKIGMDMLLFYTYIVKVTVFPCTHCFRCFIYSLSCTYPLLPPFPNLQCYTHDIDSRLLLPLPPAVRHPLTLPGPGSAKSRPDPCIIDPFGLPPMTSRPQTPTHTPSSLD